MIQDDSILISIRVHYSTSIISLHVTKIAVAIVPLVPPIGNELIPTKRRVITI